MADPFSEAVRHNLEQMNEHLYPIPNAVANPNDDGEDEWEDINDDEQSPDVQLFKIDPQWLADEPKRGQFRTYQGVLADTAAFLKRKNDMELAVTKSTVVPGFPTTAAKVKSAVGKIVNAFYDVSGFIDWPKQQSGDPCQAATAIVRGEWTHESVEAMAFELLFAARNASGGGRNTQVKRYYHKTHKFETYPDFPTRFINIISIMKRNKAPCKQMMDSYSSITRMADAPHDMMKSTKNNSPSNAKKHAAENIGNHFIGLGKDGDVNITVVAKGLDAEDSQPENVVAEDPRSEDAGFEADTQIAKPDIPIPSARKRKTVSSNQVDAGEQDGHNTSSRSKKSRTVDVPVEFHSKITALRDKAISNTATDKVSKKKQKKIAGYGSSMELTIKRKESKPRTAARSTKSKSTRGGQRGGVSSTTEKKAVQSSSGSMEQMSDAAKPLALVQSSPNGLQYSDDPYALLQGQENLDENTHTSPDNSQSLPVLNGSYSDHGQQSQPQYSDDPQALLHDQQYFDEYAYTSSDGSQSLSILNDTPPGYGHQSHAPAGQFSHSSTPQYTEMDPFAGAFGALNYGLQNGGHSDYPALSYRGQCGDYPPASPRYQ